MQAEELAQLVVEHAKTLHPEYTREQQFIWAIGILSYVVLEKNHMDNIVLARLQSRIDYLHELKHKHK